MSKVDKKNASSQPFSLELDTLLGFGMVENQPEVSLENQAGTILSKVGDELAGRDEDTAYKNRLDERGAILNKVSEIPTRLLNDTGAVWNKVGEVFD